MLLEHANLLERLHDFSLDRSRSVLVVRRSLSSVLGTTVNFSQPADADVLAEVDMTGDGGCEREETEVSGCSPRVVSARKMMLMMFGAMSESCCRYEREAPQSTLFQLDRIALHHQRPVEALDTSYKRSYRR